MRLRAITSGELTRMRDVATSLLPSSCTVKYMAMVSNGAGGYTETETTRGTHDCRVTPIVVPFNFPNQDESGGRITPSASWLIVLPYTASIDVDDWIEVGSTNYEVWEIHEGKTYHTATRVICTKMA